MWRLDDIVVFIAVVEQSSFVKAAEYLDMPTSTVSRRISELEAALQMKLLERTSRRLRVTERGQQLFEQCLPLVKNMRFRVDTLAKNRDQLSGKITMTAPHYLANTVLASSLCEFLQQHSEIELELKLSNRVEDLIDERIDLAVRIGPLRDSQFVAQYLFTPYYGLYASHAYLNHHQPILRPEDLTHHDVIVFAHQNGQITLIDEDDREHTVPTRSRMKSNDIGMTHQATLNGLSIACLPIASTHDAVTRGELVRVLDQYKITPSRDVFIVYPSRKHLSAKTRLLIEFLKNSVGVNGSNRGHPHINT